ncbi:hypothetical protein MCOR02_002470 [Pyricularia oryzae]|uniref:2-dehydropantoate 2-reductase n=1 Tax=Pyricularia oryzae TaxID=318829 RepID=A0A4P7N8K9_PYROR|nr:hypothetical protein MCOR01_008272 [Pyricularia oryzae]KAH9438873.1 hypothetical protein MCOR02_002470 [Pyricularia oryzae]KAI6259430.1 hypothetical protein MCOR19_004261 [Pyricularia oryzae]KAI6366231.1 hypothetical protein MCOR32_007490 [Pyricularia oryzae]KAI6408277.1 hypothetical protein MCOR23_001414 [Pyricularia oryzae]
METPIYILGLGNLGKYVAHALKKQSSRTHVTLLLHRESLLEEWQRCGQTIDCVRDGASDKLSGYSTDLLSGSSPINNLIVTTKTYKTVQALAPIRHRLGPESSILFLQNGMGAIEEVSTSLFKDAKLRPNYWAGIASVGIYKHGPFSIVHAGKGSLILGKVEGRTDASSPADARRGNFMVQRLLESDGLAANLVEPELLRISQLQKLAANAIINPLTALLGCVNGEVFGSSSRKNVIQQLIAETGAVIRALLPSKAGEEIREQFSDQSLSQYITEVATKTAKNSSSMLQDFRAGRETEIGYINGYIVEQAKRLGLPHARNSALVNMIKQRKALSEDDEVIPKLSGPP